MKEQTKKLVDKLPYIRGLRAQLSAQGVFPAGNYSSPIPSRDDLARKINRESAPAPLVDVDLRRDEQLKLLRTFAQHYRELPFEEATRSDCRYHFQQNWFCHTDAIILYSFIRHFDPKRIIEIGSGYSSAVMLDTLDRFPNHNLSVTFVEPYPDRLKSLIDVDANPRTKLFASTVQDVDREVFESLKPGDLLFVDSSHVMKYGSDLQMILFEILPTLEVGTHVHFHDIFYPFEYPSDWMTIGVFWNECYLLRAFLAYNAAWQITFFNHYANLEFADYIEENMPLCRKNFGGSLYIQRIA
jgi:predicted O-methyltransferase YrrM